MADTCFADYSALGAGVSNYDNELTEAPEEEEDFDVLNDETFGDFGNDDFDWEQQTEKFAEELDPKFQPGRNDDSGFSTAEKTYKSQEEYMERNISQLMIDDEDVDPAIVNLKKSRPIPRKQQSLDMLFGPASPPSFLDTEYLVSPTSKNIWGSPVTEAYTNKQTHVDNIQSLFDFAKSASTESSGHHQHHPGHGLHPKPSALVLPKAQTLEELESSFHQKPLVLTAEQLERQLLGESPEDKMRRPMQPPNLPNGHPMPPMNVPPPNMHHPARPMGPLQGVPPAGMVGIVNGHRSPTPGGMPPGPGIVGTPIGRGASRNGHPGPYSSSPMPGPQGPSPHPMGATPPYRNVSTPLNRQSPVFMYTRTSPLIRSPSPPPMTPVFQSPVVRVPARFASPCGVFSQSRYIATPGRGFSQPIGIPRGMRNVPPGSSPYNSPQQGYGSPQQGSYPSPQQYRMQPPPSGSYGDNGYNRNMNNKYQSPQQNRGNFHNNKDRQIRHENQYNREHRYHRYPYNQQHEERVVRNKDEDEYAGLMIQKEKDWIIKIQLLQLQTENPYLDDYYYTAFTMKKKAQERMKDGKEDDGDPKLVIPAMARIENKSYKPAQFEGSLGRLTTSSVHNPRQIIDLLAKSVSESTGGSKMTTNVGKELRKSRQLLMDIEKGYNFILEIDDLEKKILALPEEMRKPLFEMRGYKIDLLFHYLLCDGNSAAFMQYMKVRKGRSLTMRALPLLDKVQSVGIVSLICKNIQQLMKKENPNESLVGLFEPCAKVIESCNLATIVMFVEDIQQEESQSTSKPIAIALQNKFGCSMLCSLLHRGEEIYTSTSPVDMDNNLQNEWSEFVHDFAGIMATIPIESVSAPMHVYSDIGEHLERHLNKKLMALVRDNLRIFTRSSEKMDNES